jgi:hypothetical protein
MSELSVDSLSGSSGLTVTIKTGHTLTLVEDLDAGTAKLTNLGEPSASSDAATKNYVDTQLLTLDTIGELTDVTIASVADNEVLAYDSTSSEWINQTASEAGLATSGDLTSHTSDTSNPHGVTAAQAGATTTSNQITDFTAPTSDLDMNSNKITSVSDPTLAQDAATKNYVDTQVASKDDLSELSGDTDDVTEGTFNLYFTNERVDDRFNDLFQDGTGLTGTYDDGSNTYTLNLDAITNANVDAAAAIDQSKLNLSITNSEVNASAAIDATKIHDGSVTNAEFGYIGGLSSDAQTQLDAKLALAGGTLSGNVAFGDNEASGVVLKDYAETDVAVSSSTGVVAIDLANGNTGSLTLTENVTDIDFTNVPTNGVSSFTLKITQDASSAYTVAINAITVNGGGDVTAKTAGGSGFTMSTTLSGEDLVTFLFFDASTPYLNALQDFS